MTWRRPSPVAALGVVHALVFALATLLAVRSFPAARAAFDPAAPPSAVDFVADVARLMPRFMRQVPRDARVLLLTDRVVPLPLALHTSPRPTRFLMRVDDRLVRKAAHYPGVDPREVQNHFDWIDRHAMRFTPERERDAIAQSDWVVLFGADPATFLAPDLPLEPVDVLPATASGVIGLWRVRRP